MTLTFGSLFAGIGGFDLGFERAGMQCKWQVEIDPYCQRVLAKHWPNVRRHDDVRTFPPRSFEFGYSWRTLPLGPFAPDVCRDATRDEWGVDVICGGFPCQDISNAGTKLGLDGERSGLWREYARIVRLLRPSYVVVENSPALLGRGMGTVLADFSRIGFDAVWEVISACAFGTPHTRRRLFIVAYANGLDGRQRVRNPLTQQDWSLQADDGSPRARFSYQTRLANPSELYRGADGIADGPQRNHAIGNAVCPDVAQWIGERIVAATTHPSPMQS